MIMEKLFKLKENGTNVRTEIIAGITTFMTMAYILAVNPSILSTTGMDPTAVLLATCFSSFLATMCMAFFANLPFALSAGMGLNAYFAYTVCGSMGYPWQVALMAVFVEGLIFIVLSLTNVREAIFNAIPLSLKSAVVVGIGIYICFIGLKNANIVVHNDSTLVAIRNFGEDFSTAGISALLALAGLFFMVILYLRKVPGAILIGIVVTWGVGIILEYLHVYVPDPEAGFNSLIPDFAFTDFFKIKETYGCCFDVDMRTVGVVNFMVVVFSFLFVDMFDTLGTLIGVSQKAGILDKDGNLPGIKPALLADAIGTTAGAFLGTSTVSTYVESSTGVGAGGRTGLTAVTTAILFLLSTLFAPFFTAIPSFATSPALILVGFMMFCNIKELKLDADHYTEAIPAFLCIVAMPLFYSISEGISVGIISYVIINLLCGKRKNIKPLMYVLVVLFFIKYIYLS